MSLSFSGCVSKIRSPIREERHSINLNKPVQDRVSLIQQITTPRTVRVITFSTFKSISGIPGCYFLRSICFLLLSSQLTRNQSPLVTRIPDLVSTHPKDDWLSHNDDQYQQDSASFSLHHLKFKPSCDSDGRGVHVYVHPEDGFSKHGEESEEEVKLHSD